MKDLILLLNTNGFWTTFCCQGKTKLSEFDSNSHNITAYVVFAEAPKKILESKNLLKFSHFLKNNSLGVYSMEMIHKEEYDKLTTESKQRIIEANLCFPELIRHELEI